VTKVVPVESTQVDAPTVEVAVLTFEAGTAPPAVVAGDDKPKKPKAARKPKPCSRCDERRKREREYARVSRQRAKTGPSADASKDASSTESTSGAAAAVSADADPMIGTA
jgi:hypothetical protein